MNELLPFLMSAVDVLILCLLGGIALRLRRDPIQAWREREEKLRGLYDDLRALVSQAEGMARDLDARLAVQEGKLRALVDTVAHGASDGASAVGCADPFAEEDGVGEGATPDWLTALEGTPEQAAQAKVGHDAGKAAPAKGPSISPVVAARAEILGLTARGRTPQEIAVELNLPVAEVRVVASLVGSNDPSGSGSANFAEQFLPVAYRRALESASEVGSGPAARGM